MLANLLQDIRYSLHGFALRPMFAAGYWPARRASRVDPVTASRDD